MAACCDETPSEGSAVNRARIMASCGGPFSRGKCVNCMGSCNPHSSFACWQRPRVSLQAPASILEGFLHPGVLTHLRDLGGIHEKLKKH